ncbi:MAG TPA: bifunctional UDP-sugar hydrolase/5'-nucleotidase [Bacteroidales bacterium]|nr:bifunctional UDP-sugar hydrolase/5'-nucleotidase [Bacteroidales bacterium]
MKNRNLLSQLIFLFSLVFLISCTNNQEKRVTLIETTDIHGTIFPYDFIEDQHLDGSLSHASSFVNNLRNNGENVVLLDNGDNLQGQPAVYYYNFIDTVSAHVLVSAMNYMNYDAGTTGNHDFEAGHPVYDRLKKDYNFKLLAANAIDKNSGEPYFNAYTIIERGGIKIAVLGLVTASIPEWLPSELYSGIEFRDMVETAKKWMPIMKKENPDLIVGLFHSGWNKEEFEERKDEFLTEDGSAAVAYNVPGFDIIFNGHDHRLANEKFINREGDTVLMLNAGSKVRNVARVDIVVRKDGTKKMTGNLVDVTNIEPDSVFLRKFDNEYKTILEYVNRQIGTSETTMSSRDSYFGPSAFVDMIHTVQLDITGADISFTAPLSFDVRIAAGPIRVSDMFKLYRYENMLYTMELTGEEILKYLEYSYSGWLNTMKNSNDLMLRLRTGKDRKPVLTDGKAWLINQPYNFDSAAGIDYTVDVTKPEGERVKIKSLSNGNPFDLKKRYKVAVNSYRGSGGGGHLTQGSGLSATELNSRLLGSTDKDLRYFILKYIEEKKVISPVTLGNWSIIPVEWSKKAELREYKLLFGNN